jgi:Asp-tRNA(Asn)/Glu-tRNA(Gln) amidotransferase A subunit family amidase
MARFVPILSLAVTMTSPRALLAQEHTIASVHAALRAHELTCVQLVEHYLDRIEAFDDRGPALNAILTVNPRALEQAAEVDRAIASGTMRPLECVPVILKDNYNTADLPTTGGSRTLAQSRPRADATIVSRLRAAGAVVIAKSNLTELAWHGTTVSSLGGQTRNPYDLTRTPGGSSGGTGAAIAANFGLVGTGSDTGQSTRSPASAQSLVGVRPTRGLISRAGIIPLGSTQDEAGPITRTVADAARMLDVMVGYDPADPITALGHGRPPATYTASLDRDALAGARIGLLMDFVGGEAIHEPVNAVVRTAVARMEELGASVVEVRIPRLADLTRDIILVDFEFKSAFDRYLADLGPEAPVRSLEEFVARGEYDPSLTGIVERSRVADGTNDPEYRHRLVRREELRAAVMKVMAENRLDAILYPHQRRLVAPIGEEQLERNGVLSNSTGLPAVTFPGGFSDPTATAPIGVPVGIELLGPEWTEPRLLALAYAFEQRTGVRRPPVSTPLGGR